MTVQSPATPLDWLPATAISKSKYWLQARPLTEARLLLQAAGEPHTPFTRLTL